MDRLKIISTVRHGDRARGCNKLAMSSDPDDLNLAMQAGNRATRRKAERNLRKLQKNEGRNAN